MRKCPQCGSRDARPSHRRELERWVAAFQIRPFRCYKCHRRFWWLDLVSPRSTDFGPLVPAILVLAAAAGAALYMAGLPYAGEASAPPPGAGVMAETDDQLDMVPSNPGGRTPGGRTPDGRTPGAGAERRFGGVETVEIADRRLRLKVKTGGTPTAWSHFFLARPPRYAIDLEGRWLLPQSISTFLNHPLVKAVHADRHDSALRVAIELGPAAVAEPTIEEVADGLIVTFSGSQD